MPRKQWQRLSLRRLLHCIVAALIFLHGGGTWPSSEHLWRLPHAHQRACHRRLWGFVVACASRKERFDLPPGRSGPELLARLVELESFAEGLHDGWSYDGKENASSNVRSPSFSSDPTVPAVRASEELPQLMPYRSLDVSHFRLSGTGSWPIINHLEGPFWLPFLEPRILQHHGPLSGPDLPSFAKEDSAENLKLALLWDAQKLLVLHPPLGADEAPRHTCRIFNAYKDLERDSPQGHLLAALHLHKGLDQAVAFMSDRKDFHHQTQVTVSSNRLPFSYPLSAFEGTYALADLRTCMAGLHHS